MTDFEKEKMVSQTFSIDGMTCQGCVQQVQTALQKSPAISNVAVFLKPPIAKVTFSPEQISFDQIRKLLPAPYLLIESPEDRDLGDENEIHPTLNLISIGGESKEPDASTPEIAPQAVPKNLFTYWPLILVVSYILAGTFITMAVSMNWSPSFGMRIFMGLFFMVFSFFKLLDLRGFANAYRSYDWIAKKIPQYGFIYPVIELGLGIGYLIGFSPLMVNWATLIVMVVSIAGVIDAVLRRSTIRCACLGTGFNLPMSTVTIIEDGTMILMATIMIWNLS